MKWEVGDVGAFNGNIFIVTNTNYHYPFRYRYYKITNGVTGAFSFNSYKAIESKKLQNKLIKILFSVDKEK